MLNAAKRSAQSGQIVSTTDKESHGVSGEIEYTKVANGQNVHLPTRREQRTYMIGKMYEARKNSHGNHAERGEDGKYLSRQNGDLGEGKTSVAIAKELGIGQKTVERSEKFAKGVDALKQVSPEAADKVHTFLNALHCHLSYCHAVMDVTDVPI